MDSSVLRSKNARKFELLSSVQIFEYLLTKKMFTTKDIDLQILQLGCFENYQFRYLSFMSSLHIGRLIGTSEGKDVAKFLLCATLS